MSGPIPAEIKSRQSNGLRHRRTECQILMDDENSVQSDNSEMLELRNRSIRKDEVMKEFGKAVNTEFFGQRLSSKREGKNGKSIVSPNQIALAFLILVFCFLVTLLVKSRFGQPVNYCM